jgi:Amt family ammonium transporter
VNAFSEASLVLCAVLIAILPLAPAGLALLNAGLGRSRSAAQAMLGALCLVAVAALAYSLAGYSLEGFAGLSSHSIIAGATNWNWVATRSPLVRGLAWRSAPEICAAAFQTIAVGIAALAAWGSGAERWRLGSATVATAILAGFVYPLFAHWVWGGGWLAQLGSSFHLGMGFADPGGAATLQTLGGIAALAAVWILGPRRGKFSSNAAPAALPAHHIVYVLLGATITLVGWLALNAIGAILFASASPEGVALVELNTIVCASAALIGAFIVTRIRFRKPDASLCANGWIAGLVASSAVAALVSPGAALFTGVVAGAILPPAIEAIELRCGLDDPSGGIAVHGLSGLWGLLAAGLFARGPAGQLLAQLVGIGTLLGLVLPALYAVFWLLNRVMPFRTHPEGERIGMDLHELGAGAYPEFVLHSDDFIPR